MATVETNLGRVSIRPRGTYDASTTYERLDMVLANDGNSYIYINGTSSSGNPVSDTTYWQLSSVGGSGHVQYATFNIDDNGDLIMNYTENFSGMTFQINSSGELEVHI